MRDDRDDVLHTAPAIKNIVTTVTVVTDNSFLPCPIFGKSEKKNCSCQLILEWVIFFSALFLIKQTVRKIQIVLIKFRESHLLFMGALCLQVKQERRCSRTYCKS